MALGRLANYSDDLAEAVVQNEILPQLVREAGRGAAGWPLARSRAGAMHAGCPAARRAHAVRHACQACCHYAPVCMRMPTTAAQHAAWLGWGKKPSSMTPPASSLGPRPRAPAPARQVYSLSEQNRFYKKAAGYCLRAVAKHSPELAQAVVDSGALDSLVTCLEEFDPGVKVGARAPSGDRVRARPTLPSSGSQIQPHHLHSSAN